MSDIAQKQANIICVYQLFELQVERAPDAIAVVESWDSTTLRELTYQELNTRSNQLARYLQKLGVGPETVVGIYIERSLELVVSILGALKAGGAYLALDPDHPVQRLNFILEDAEASVLLTRQELGAKLETNSMQVVCLDADWDAIVAEPADNPVCMVGPENLAYVIYTSGSSGAPKGVMIPHRSLCNHMTWMQSTFPLNPSDRVLQKTAISFDASVWEFYAPLLAGARLVMARPGGHRDLAYLVETIRQAEITIVQVVPTVLRLLIEEPGLRECDSLRRLFCGGEALPAELAMQVRAILDVELVNLYGPAEACIDTLYYTVPRIGPIDKIPIGRPIANTQVYIMDDQLRPVREGEVGELFLAGDSLGRGYHNQPALTAMHFLPNPMDNSGGRLYRTGDLARYWTDGNILYLGRVDLQVKILGGRLELGEIERLIEQYPGVRQAAVVVQEDPGNPGARRLVAYLTLQPGAQITVDQLRTQLKRQLPDYMMPASFYFLDSLPVLSSGKLDRQALARPVPIHSEFGDDDLLPDTPFEQALAALWSDVLNVEQVGLKDNFFSLGGHSLLAFRLINRIRDFFQLDPSLTMLFEEPVFEDFVRVLLENIADRQRVDAIARSALSLRGTGRGSQTKSDDRESHHVTDPGSREDISLM